jgi:hypothetical protein
VPAISKNRKENAKTMFFQDEKKNCWDFLKTLDNKKFLETSQDDFFKSISRPQCVFRRGEKCQSRHDKCSCRTIFPKFKRKTTLT